MDDLTLQDISAQIQTKFQEGHRIVFWYDPDGSFAEDVDQLQLPDVTLLHLTDRNSFRVKLRIEHEDPHGKYLLYGPFVKPDVAVNHLEDMLLYSSQIYADKLSFLAHEAGIPSRLQDTLKKLKPFFLIGLKRTNAAQRKEAARRTQDFLERVKPILPTQLDERTLLTIAMCCAVGTQTTTVDELVYEILDETDLADNEAYKKLQSCALDGVFWNVVGERYGYSRPAPSLQDFVAALFVTYTFRTCPEAVPEAWMEYAPDGMKNKLSSITVLLENMMNNVKYQDSFDYLSKSLETFLQAEAFLSKLPLENFLETASFGCIDFLLCRWMVARLVAEDKGAQLAGLTIPELCDKRLRLHFGKNFEHAYKLLKAAWQLYMNVNYGPQHDLQAMVQAYEKQDYKIDQSYRGFLTAFDELEDRSEFEELRDRIQNIYYTKYLEEQLYAWNGAYQDQYREPILPWQRDFYREVVKPYKEKVAVIISDAFRYEAARELVERFQEDENCTVELSTRMAGVPAVTAVGMAQLLPHTVLTVTRDRTPKVLLDGRPCGSREQREKILQLANPNSIAMDYDSIQRMNSKELKSFATGQEVIYIYHNRIDATGESARTENSVFTAVNQTIRELFQLVKRLSRSANIYRFVITADHGFLYTRKPLREADKLENQADKSAFTDRRFILNEGPVEADGMYSLPLAETLKTEDTRYVLLAKGMSVFKCHGGMNYVHGGSSPQELLVPVISVSTRRGIVDTQSVKLALINDRTKISTFHLRQQFYQEYPVSDILKPAQYRIFLQDSTGEVISTEVLYTCDSKEQDAAKRLVTLDFDLKKKKYDPLLHYYIKIVNTETEEEIESKEVILDLADEGLW